MHSRVQRCQSACGADIASHPTCQAISTTLLGNNCPDIGLSTATGTPAWGGRLHTWKWLQSALGEHSQSRTRGRLSPGHSIHTYARHSRSGSLPSPSCQCCCCRGRLSPVQAPSGQSRLRWRCLRHEAPHPPAITTTPVVPSPISWSCDLDSCTISLPISLSTSICSRMVAPSLAAGRHSNQAYSGWQAEVLCSGGLYVAQFMHYAATCTALSGRMDMIQRRCCDQACQAKPEMLQHTSSGAARLSWDAWPGLQPSVQGQGTAP